MKTVNILKLLIVSVFKDLFVVFETSSRRGKKEAMKTYFRFLVLLALLFAISSPSFAFDPKQSECLAPAKPGGGMDLTCRLAANSLLAANLIDQPMAINYRPGGIGAVAYNYVVGVWDKDPQLIVAASSGEAVMLATVKFGHNGENDVRWLGALGADYGALAVRADAPWGNLSELIAAMHKNPQLTIGGGGSIGSQDWMKVALLMKEAQIEPRTIRYVAFEGGGEALAALSSGHIQVFSGDVAELLPFLEKDQLKVLAVFASERLPGKFASVPTATEQGYPVEWRVWRGYYMGKKVSDEAYNWWVNSLRRLVKTEEFSLERERLGLYPFSLIGLEFEQFVRASVEEYHQKAKKIGLLP